MKKLLPQWEVENKNFYIEIINEINNSENIGINNEVIVKKFQNTIKDIYGNDPVQIIPDLLNGAILAKILPHLIPMSQNKAVKIVVQLLMYIMIVFFIWPTMLEYIKKPHTETKKIEQKVEEKTMFRDIEIYNDKMLCVYTKPNKNSQKLENFPKGKNQIEILRKNKKWLYITYLNKETLKEGWILKKYYKNFIS